ncbi:TPA: hypothetical protein ACI7G4_005145, partial [Escherichia coli]
HLICDAYGIIESDDCGATETLFPSHFSADPVSVSYGSSSPSAQRYIPSAQHVVPYTVAHGTICCVVSLDCDAPRRGGKQRYDDFLSVVHFRKVVYSNKVGSIRNGNAVITLCFYKSDFNFYWLT